MVLRRSIIDILYLYFGYKIIKVMALKTGHSTCDSVGNLTDTLL